MLAGALLAASLALTPAQIEKIDAAVDAVMQAEHIPGLSLGIAHNGEVLFVRGYGVRNRDGDAPPDGDTTFRIGSLTKQFTAALVLKEIEQGKLAFDTQTKGVTVQQLLAQTSGLGNGTDPASPPGTVWQYNNANYVLLGTLLESASGRSFADLLRSSIITPLKLSHTSLDAASPAYAAAGMTSSVHDLLTWLDALRGGRVISESDFARMVSSQSLESGERTHYGYGWYIRDWYGWKTAEHPGYVDGYSADDALVVDDGLEIAVLANGTNAYLVPITKTVVSLLEVPRDRSLVADFSHPAENENPTVTRDVKALVAQIQEGKLDRALLSPSLNATMTTVEVEQESKLLGPLGELTLVEFIDRTAEKGIRFEKYRLSFGYKQFWMTLSYTKDGKINTLSIEPDED